MQNFALITFGAAVVFMAVVTVVIDDVSAVFSKRILDTLSCFRER